MTRLADVRSAMLARLVESGTVSDAVAMMLTRERIVGVPGSATACPIARWIRARYGTDLDVAVGLDTVAIATATESLTVALPDQAVRFVERFDCGWYPHLVEPGARKSRH